jgi:hypothetical protein
MEAVSCTQEGCKESICKTFSDGLLAHKRLVEFGAMFLEQIPTNVSCWCVVCCVDVGSQVSKQS